MGRTLWERLPLSVQLPCLPASCRVGRVFPVNTFAPCMLLIASALPSAPGGKPFIVGRCSPSPI